MHIERKEDLKKIFKVHIVSFLPWLVSEARRNVQQMLFLRRHELTHKNMQINWK